MFALSPVLGKVPFGTITSRPFPGESPGACSLGKLGFAINVTVDVLVTVSAIIVSARAGGPMRCKRTRATMIFFTIVFSFLFLKHSKDLFS